MRMSKYSGHLPCDAVTPDVDHSCAKRWGQLGVFRVLFGSTVFFGVLALVMINVRSSRDPRAALQNGLWGPKLLLIAGLAVAAFFIPNGFFLGAWGWAALVGAFAFILVQMVLLVDFAHAWAGSWTLQMEEGSRCHAFGLVAASLLLYALTITLTVLMFVFYTTSRDGERCGLNKFFVAFNVVLVGLITAVALLPGVRAALPNSGLLQSGVLGLYMTYLTWSAVSNTNGACQPASATANSTATTIFGTLFMFLSICYASLRTTAASQLGKLGLANVTAVDTAGMARLLDKDDGGNTGVGGDYDDDADDDDDDLSGGRRQRVVDSEREGVAYSWSFFHLVFAVASLHLTMVLTDYATISDGHDADIHVGQGMASVWVAAVSSWLVALLYLWSLVAPLCLPDRDFA